jgi:hypothetical protein
MPPVGRGDEKQNCSGCRRKDEQADEKRIENEMLAHFIANHLPVSNHRQVSTIVSFNGRGW